MTFQFKSQVTGDIIMLTDDAQRLLEIVGKSPSSTGIIQPEEMDQAIVALERAASEPDQRFQDTAGGAESDPVMPPVAMGQRTFPLLEMLRRCRQAGESVVWEA